VKLYDSETVLEVLPQAMELHGGSGTMLELGIEKLYRDASCTYGGGVSAPGVAR
jgi:alkylation response protein AidB-like acyl-CoA dehydrogenase